MKASITADTRVTICTTGVLLQHLITKKHMNDFTHLIIDEVHERDQEMDFLLLIVRNMLRSCSQHVKVYKNQSRCSVQNSHDIFFL
jgi:ATP-dependent RNA helicase TDRD9